MMQVLRRRPAPLYCTRCGGELCWGEVYWLVNGSVVCEACLPSFAREELAPFRRIRGREESL